MNVRSIADREKVAHQILEGTSLRATCRLTGIATPTILSWIRGWGAAALSKFDRDVRDLSIKTIQCDEMYSFVQSKRFPIWLWVAMDPKTKLVITWRSGDRTLATGENFMADVRERVIGFPAFHTDGCNIYSEAVDRCVPMSLHLVQKSGDYKKKRFLGGASTSAVERHNLTIRRSLNRFSRGTQGFSKTIDLHNAHLGLYFWHYNFCRVHRTLRVTPAMEVGLANSVLELSEIVSFYPPPMMPVGEEYLPIDRTALAQAHCDGITPLIKPPRVNKRRRDHKPDDPLRVSPEWKVA